MSRSRILTRNLGYPRIGEMRELKKAVEAYWKGAIALDELERVGRELRARHWERQRRAGIDLIPSNDFSFYDHVLDTSRMVGNIPSRFGWSGGRADLDTAFLVARGESPADARERCCGAHEAEAFASEMTKWFDTNYHYIAPEFSEATEFRYASSHAVDAFLEAKALGIATMPVLVGPVTYLTLGKARAAKDAGFDRFSLFERLLPVYEDVLRRLAASGARWAQIDEPILALDLDDTQRALLERSCAALKAAAPQLKLMVATYFGPLGDNLELACGLACDALHIDAARGNQEVDTVAQTLPRRRALSLGIVDGRNVWKNDYDASLAAIRRAIDIRGADTLMLAPSCSLLHCPVSLANESALDGEVKSWLAFADEKLVEIAELAALAGAGAPRRALEANRAAIASRRGSRRTRDAAVRARADAATADDARRPSPFPVRQKVQREALKLPAFPATTIGSFPQTKEVRAARARWKRGEWSDIVYDAFLKEQTHDCVAFQVEIGIDVLVHGEFERNDMVEYFGEQLEGFAFTENGWVQSYGSRCVKPPIVFGDVSRPKPMTVYWADYAQMLTDKPVKGMLTGPVTILQWSFVRDDQPRAETAKQIALAIRDEVLDLEKAGIRVIQIDEPALREGLPLRRRDWASYLDWAVEAFRLSAGGARDETQIHTHMCYSEFNDIVGAIAALDADVITIETARSNMELLDAFVDFNYPAEIGPGVYDIHSPRVPEVEEMADLMRKAMRLLPPENLWVNPDCGLKTRAWAEVKPALRRMVECARALRAAAPA